MNLKKKITAAGVGIATLAVGAGAFAFWSTTTAGSGTASTGSQVAYHVTGGSDPSNALAPGVDAQALTATVTNAAPQAEPRPQNVQVSITVDPLASNAAVIAGGTCDATDYTLSNGGTMNLVPASLAPLASGAVASYQGVSISFKDKGTGTNQDACQGATVHITYASA